LRKTGKNVIWISLQHTVAFDHAISFYYARIMLQIKRRNIKERKQSITFWVKSKKKRGRERKKDLRSHESIKKLQ